MEQEEREELLKLTTLAQEQMCSQEDILAENFKVYNHLQSLILEEPSTERGKAIKKKNLCF